MSGYLFNNLRYIGILTIFVAMLWVGGLSQEACDWDEHTFMVMAQDVINGHLPYVHIFDNKPPGIFFLTAFFMNFLGENIFAMRVLGAICVFITALMTYLVLMRLTTRLFSALTTLCMVSLMGHHTSSELPVVALVSICLWLVLRYGKHLWSAACVGLLISLATLVRSNEVILCIGLGLLYTCKIGFKNLPFPKLAVIAYTVAGLIPPALLTILYYVHNQLNVFLISVLAVPFYYSSSQGGYSNISTVGVSLLLVALFFYVFFNIKSKRSFLESIQSRFDAFFLTHPDNLFQKIAHHIGPREGFNGFYTDFIIVFIVFIFSAISIFFNGALYRHHFMVIISVSFVLFAYVCREFSSAVVRGFLLVGMSIYIACSTIMHVPEALNVLANYKTLEASYDIKAIAQAIQSDKRRGDIVWALQGQIVYVYLNQSPPSYSSAHPDNPLRRSIVEPLVKSGAVAPGEIDRLLQSGPDYILTYLQEPVPDYMRFKQGYISGKDKDLAELLKNRYVAWLSRGKYLVYKRVE